MLGEIYGRLAGEELYKGAISMENQEQNKVSKLSVFVDVIITVLLIVFLIGKWTFERKNSFYSNYCEVAFNVTFIVFAIRQAIRAKKTKSVRTLYFITAGLFAVSAVIEVITIIG